MEILLQELINSLSTISSPTITNKILKQEEKKLSDISKNPDFYSLIEYVLTNQVCQANKILMIWTVSVFHKQSRLNYSILSQEKSLHIISFLFQLLANRDFTQKKYIDIERLVEVFVVFYSKVYAKNKEILSKIYIDWETKYFYKFLGSIPVIINDTGIVIDDADLQKFTQHYLREILPQFFSSDYFETKVTSSNEPESIIGCLVFYNNFLLFIFENEKSENPSFLSELIKLGVKPNVLSLAVGRMFDPGVCEFAYEMVTQLIQTTLAIGVTFDFMIQLFDMFIDECFQCLQTRPKEFANLNVSMLVKLTLKLFQNYPESLKNIDKAILFSLEFFTKSSKSILSSLVGFKKFLKKIAFQKNKTKYIDFINTLWKKLPSIIELNQREYLENEKIYKNSKFEFDSQKSEFDYIYVRRNSYSLCKYLIYFLDSSDILEVLTVEIERLMNTPNSQRTLEALTHFFFSIFAMIKESNYTKPELIAKKRYDIIEGIVTKQVNFSRILKIYNLIFPLLLSEGSLQIKINIFHFTKGSLVYLNRIQYFVNENFFKAFQFLLQNSHTIANDKYNKYLKASAECCFAIIDKNTMMQNIAFVEELMFDKNSEHRMFEALVKGLINASNEEVLVEVTRKVMQLINTELANFKDENGLSNLMIKLKSVCKICSDAKIGQISLMVLSCIQKVCEAVSKNDYIAEKTSQVMIGLFKRVSQSEFAGSFLVSSELQSCLGQILSSFEKTYFPSYIYIFEILTKQFYQLNYFDTFRFFFDKITSSVIDLIQPNYWNKGYIVINGEPVHYSQKFSFLFDSSGLEIDDILNDYFGFITKMFEKDPRFFLESSQVQELTKMIINSYDHSFIYSVKTILDVLPVMLRILDRNLVQSNLDFWMGFWFLIIEKTVCFIFEECLNQDSIENLIVLLGKINLRYQDNTFTQTKVYLSMIPNTVLTENEKNAFYVMVTQNSNFDDKLVLEEVRAFVKKLNNRIYESRKASKVGKFWNNLLLKLAFRESILSWFDDD